jgi:hypothetical protein
MRKVILASLVFVSILFGASETSFPKDWKEYKEIKTPVATIGGALPDCSADVSSLPKIYQETVATYCNIKHTGPGRVSVLVKPDAVDIYKKRDGKYKDGDITLFHLKDLKAFFVTEYKDGKPLYGVYTEDGKDISNAQGTGLNPQDCRVCHTGYEAWCVNGQCGKIVK